VNVNTTVQANRVLSPADVPPIAGLRLRRYGGVDDVPEMVRVNQASHVEDDWQQLTTEASMSNDLAHPTTIPSAEGVTLAEVDGQLVAYWQIDIEDGTAGERVYWSFGHVHPDWRRRGIGRALLRQAQAEMLALAEAEAGRMAGRDRFLESWAPNNLPAAMHLLESEGYSPARWFFDMVRPTLDDITDFPLPEGLEIRAVTPDQWRRIFDADIEAFRDHWGGLDGSDRSYEGWRRSPTFDPSLWVVAWDGDEPAGGSINAIDAGENEAWGLRRGWLHSVWVRRPWRRRGLARALVSRSLVALRERGMTSAILGVDADNPTGALGVYEVNGFRVDKRSTAYRKLLSE
jgi:mycothiol synthase